MSDDELIAKEATEWFVRLLEPSSQVAYKDKFSSWLLQSPQHVQAYLNVTRTWTMLGQIDDSLSAEELIRAARRDTSIPLQARRFSLFGEINRWTKLAAAAVLLIAIVGVGRLTYDRWDSAVEYVTAIGEQRTVDLEDGSRVQLNTNTQLTVTITDLERQVRLNYGEARFTVTKDSSRAFVVSTPEAAVRVLGTIFNVQTSGGKTAVAVIEGRVNVTGSASIGAQQTAIPLLLSSGERAMVAKGSGIKRNAGPLLERVEAWPRHLIVFHDEQLADVVAEFNRYNKQPLRIADPELAGMVITGTFSSDDPASLLDFLKRYKDTQVHTAPDGSQILSRGAKRAQ
jgi:transmembrane sensor